MNERKTNTFSYPNHGGELEWAVEHFSVPKEQWIDLSTGISPWPWPVPTIPPNIFQELPKSIDSDLLAAAGQYYGVTERDILAVPGTQFVIARIPHHVTKGSVALPSIGYKEHELAWRKAGHNIFFYHGLEELKQLLEEQTIHYLVVINPNNPSGEYFAPKDLYQCYSSLMREQGRPFLMFVDETFIDSKPDLSLCNDEIPENTIVLRSVGKFFGMAGLRIGFMIAESPWLESFRVEVLPWLVNHPAQYLSEKMLLDRQWITEQIARIGNASNMMEEQLRDYFQQENIVNGGLFLTVFLEREAAREHFVNFAKRGIYLRYGEELNMDECWLRFGLPGDAWEDFCQRLEN